MKKTYLLFSAFCASFFNASAQQTFDPSIETEFDKPTVVMPPSPLQYQILFVGGVDQVEGKNGATAAKEQHDFIGVTPDPDSDDLGWISVNHETVEKNENLGDGGGMTVFKVKRDPITDTLIIVEQTLNDGRTGNFFNVDFSATGETGMNCGGIVGPEGRIWTAEEWWRYSNSDLIFPKAYKGDFDTKGIEDTADFLVSTDLTGDFDGTTIRKYENMNYMVEIDPREAKAIRKQYNWGRQPFEGGAIAPDGKTVYLGADDAPGFFSKFVADQANDFTSGKLFVYREGLADQGGTYLKKLSTYTANAPFDEGACEISAFDPASKRLFSVNAFQQSIDIIDLTDPMNIDSIGTLDLSAYGKLANSVGVKNGIVAAAIEADVKQDNGKIVLWEAATGSFIGAFETGALPDMLTFTPDGTKIVCANEGEPSKDYSNDPEGSVTILELSGTFPNLTVNSIQIGFSEFNANGSKALGEGVKMASPAGTSVAQDLEPEYVAISADSKTAYISCQENNAMAVLNLETNEIVKVYGLGTKDYSLAANAIDASDKTDGITLQTWPVKSLYQPDAIAFYEAGNKGYIVTANEGDARDYWFEADSATCVDAGNDWDDEDGCLAYTEETRLGKISLDTLVFPNYADLQDNNQLGRLKITTAWGDTDNDGEFEEIYGYGARSFSIWDAETGALVWDSENAFETIIAEYNKAHEGAFAKGRSDDKGPEPEAVEIAKIGDKTLAFIGCERTSGIFVYDITNPNAPEYIEYVTNRDFSKDEEDEHPNAGDIAPEDILFVGADLSPNGKDIIVVSNEVSGTVTVFEVIMLENGITASNWIEIDNSSFDKMLNFKNEAIAVGATMYNRLEWVAYNTTNDKVYLTETGRDDVYRKWKDEAAQGASFAQHHIDRADAKGLNLVEDYYDYYGRVLEFDPATDKIRSYIHGGPDLDSVTTLGNYPDKHLSNPDGLNFLYVNDKTYMIICEDLNGSSYGRVPDGMNGKTCEMFLLDMDMDPKVENLIRISQAAFGAEITGAVATPDGKSILVNSQHPSSSNPEPYNHSLTFAITGWDKVGDITLDADKFEMDENGAFQIFPNPATRNLQFSKTVDAALYNADGKRVRVFRNVSSINVEAFEAGMYFLKTTEGDVEKLVIQ